jgi:hypothetical protein
MINVLQSSVCLEAQPRSWLPFCDTSSSSSSRALPLAWAAACGGLTWRVGPLAEAAVGAGALAAGPATWAGGGAGWPLSRTSSSFAASSASSHDQRMHLATNSLPNRKGSPCNGQKKNAGRSDSFGVSSAQSHRGDSNP